MLPPIEDSVWPGGPGSQCRTSRPTGDGRSRALPQEDPDPVRWFGYPRHMVHLALRTLLYDRVRFLIAVGGVAFAILLMLVLRGILDGTVAKSTAYVDHAGAASSSPSKACSISRCHRRSYPRKRRRSSELCRA